MNSRLFTFDHFVGEREQLVRNIEAERLSGLEVDHQLLELRRQLDRKIGRFCAFEDPPCRRRMPSAETAQTD
jgi:hypothetical protein